MKILKMTLMILVCGAPASAQLVVTPLTPKFTGQKAVVSLAMKNSFIEKVDSARATLFLMDEQGKIVGQATRWVIGGSNTNGLSAGATNIFHFVVTATKPITTTNLTTKVIFNRVVLEGGKLADVTKDVQIQFAPK